MAAGLLQVRTGLLAFNMHAHGHCAPHILIVAHLLIRASMSERHIGHSFYSQHSVGIYALEV